MPQFARCTNSREKVRLELFAPDRGRISKGVAKVQSLGFYVCRPTDIPTKSRSIAEVEGHKIGIWHPNSIAMIPFYGVEHRGNEPMGVNHRSLSRG